MPVTQASSKWIRRCAHEKLLASWCPGRALNSSHLINWWNVKLVKFQRYLLSHCSGPREWKKWWKNPLIYGGTLFDEIIIQRSKQAAESKKKIDKNAISYTKQWLIVGEAHHLRNLLAVRSVEESEKKKSKEEERSVQSLIKNSHPWNWKLDLLAFSEFLLLSHRSFARSFSDFRARVVVVDNNNIFSMNF